MQHNELTLQLVEQVVATMADITSKMNQRIDALEQSAGVHILDDIDFGRTDYRNKTLARHAGGLWQYSSGDGWKCVANSIDGVELGEADGLMTLAFTKSDGTTIERQLQYAKPRRKAA